MSPRCRRGESASAARHRHRNPLGPKTPSLACGGSGAVAGRVQIACGRRRRCSECPCRGGGALRCLACWRANADPHGGKTVRRGRGCHGCRWTAAQSCTVRGHARGVANRGAPPPVTAPPPSPLLLSRPERRVRPRAWPSRGRHHPYAPPWGAPSPALPTCGLSSRWLPRYAGRGFRCGSGTARRSLLQPQEARTHARRGAPWTGQSLYFWSGSSACLPDAQIRTRKTANHSKSSQGERQSL